jgi:hypothetical protein
MVYTRSGNNSNGSGYQPFEDRAASLGNQLSSVTSVIDTMGQMLGNITGTSRFEQEVLSYLNLLHSTVKDMKTELAKLRDEMIVRNRNVRDTVDDLMLSVVKTEQYSRRDTVTVVGLPVDNVDAESQSELTRKVATQLSLSGETVEPSDLSAVHRNSRQIKEIKGRKVPPSVTVRFVNINKKDKALRGYKNYDSVEGKSRDVKIYQSLTTHYSQLRGSMLDFFNSKPGEGKGFGRIKNSELKAKWITYQSPSSGFAVKLENGDYFNRIHVWQDFVDIILEKFPNCRVNC